jgi:hypothetical protein
LSCNDLSNCVFKSVFDENVSTFIYSHAGCDML